MSNIDDGDDEAGIDAQGISAAPASTSYKVLGEFSDSSGAGVQGKNTASSGTPIGVEGAVPNASGGYGLSTPHDARVEGALDTVGELAVNVDGNRALFLGGESSGDAGAVLAGYSGNNVQNGAVGAAIGGGGSSGSPNEVLDNYGTIGGGAMNAAGNTNADPGDAEYATIAGGSFNAVEGESGTISGGYNNDVTGNYATVAGGRDHTAGGTNSTVGGGTGNTTNGFGSTAGGGRLNTVSGDYSTIAGGGPSDLANPSTTKNTVLDGYGTIAGGGNNQAGEGDGTGTYATVAGGRNNVASGGESVVGGGQQNVASGTKSAVAGGFNNEASGNNATVPGGTTNTASANDTFAAGSNAIAQNNNAFVWNDGSAYFDSNSDSADDSFTSAASVNGEPVNGPETFNVSASGGVRFVTGPSSVTYIESGSTGWSATSTRAAKTNVEPVDPESALDGVQSLEVATWEYRDEDGEGTGTTRIGPMAEEFHDAFDVGDSDEHINSVDADGVAFAAIQGLAERAESRAERIDELEAENESLREQNAELESRLGELERQVADRTDDASGVATADD